MAERTTVTSETTSPTIQPLLLLETMIAAIATPMPTIPAVAIRRVRIRSAASGRRLRPGSMLGVCSRSFEPAPRPAPDVAFPEPDLTSGEDPAGGVVPPTPPDVVPGRGSDPELIGSMFPRTRR